MADIHVETKKQNTIPAWVWILITLAVVALLAFFLTRDDSATDQNKNVNNSNATSYIHSDANVMYHLG